MDRPGLVGETFTVHFKEYWFANFNLTETNMDINQLRKDLDGLNKLFNEGRVVIKLDTEAAEQGSVIFFKELGSYYDSLRLAKAWLGELAGQLGVPSPYSTGKKETSDIEPVHDSLPIDKNFLEDFNKASLVAKLDGVRTMLENNATIVAAYQYPEGVTPKDSRSAAICRTNVYTHIKEAKLYLGYALGVIRDFDLRTL